MTQLGTSTILESETRTEERLGHGPKAHIVKRGDSENRTAAAAVLEARFNGTPLEALCGHVWVPSRDPKKLPLCETCKAIFELHGDLGDHGGGDPESLPS